MRHFPAILLVWLGCTFAWVVLGSSLVARTGSSTGALGREVHLLWGPPMEQRRPAASYPVTTTRIERVQRKLADGREAWVEEAKACTTWYDVPLDGSRLDVRLDLTHRRKGLLWFPTYAVDFDGTYAFRNAGSEARDAEVSFPLAGEGARYDGFEVTDAAGRPVAAKFEGERARFAARFEAGERREFRVRYRSRGTTSWSYRLLDGTGEVRNFALAVTTNFAKVDFAPGSISPSRHAPSGRGWSGTWEFSRLVANAPISVVLPEKLNPGPLASRITYFAPVGLLFFIAVVAILSTTAGIRIHPMNYFFFGCAFFAFHLLFAYLVDHVAVVPSFTIASLVSLALVASYARLFTGWEFALQRVAVAQLVYLVMFSTTFFWEGYTGLAITVGAILTLFVMMQVTGRFDWEKPNRPEPRPA